MVVGWGVVVAGWGTISEPAKRILEKPYTIIFYFMAAVTSRQTLSFASGWSLEDKGDILIQSARPPPPSPKKLTHLTLVIQLRAPVH